MNAPSLPLIRAAKVEDYAQIMSICVDLAEENAMLDVSWPMVEATIMRGINRDQALIGLIGPVGAIEGIVYLQLANMWYSEKIIIQELFLYVRPEFRRSKNAKALLHYTLNTRKRLDAKLIIGVISNERTKAKLAFYERHLGAPVGGFFYIEG